MQDAQVTKSLLSFQMSPSDHEDENDPDGIFAFRRKRDCQYYAVSIEQYLGKFYAAYIAGP